MVTPLKYFLGAGSIESTGWGQLCSCYSWFTPRLGLIILCAELGWEVCDITVFVFPVTWYLEEGQTVNGKQVRTNNRLIPTYFSGSDRPSSSTPLSSAGLKHSHQNQNIGNRDLQVLVSNDRHHDADDEISEGEPENTLLTTSSRSSNSSYPVSDLAVFSLNSSELSFSMLCWDWLCYDVVVVADPPADWSPGTQAPT